MDHCCAWICIIFVLWMLWKTFCSFSTNIIICSWRMLYFVWYLIPMVIILILYFNCFFGGHMSFLWGHRYTCFGLLVMFDLGFKVRMDLFACLLDSKLFLRLTSGVTLADLLKAGMAAYRVPYMWSRGRMPRRATQSATTTGLMLVILTSLFWIHYHR